VRRTSIPVDDTFCNRDTRNYINATRGTSHTLVLTSNIPTLLGYLNILHTLTSFSNFGEMKVRKEYARLPVTAWLRHVYNMDLKLLSKVLFLEGEAQQSGSRKFRVYHKPSVPRPLVQRITPPFLTVVEG